MKGLVSSIYSSNALSAYDVSASRSDNKFLTKKAFKVKTKRLARRREIIRELASAIDLLHAAGRQTELTAAQNLYSKAVSALLHLKSRVGDDSARPRRHA